MASMKMPKTAINKNNSFKFGEYQIWLTGKFLAMQAIAVASGKQSLSNQNLGLGVLALNPGHHSGAGLTIDNINH